MVKVWDFEVCCFQGLMFKSSRWYEICVPHICGSLGWMSCLEKDSLTQIFSHINYSATEFSNSHSHISYWCKLSMTTSIIIVWIFYICSPNGLNICVGSLVSFYEVILNVYVCSMYFSYKYKLTLPMEIHLILHEDSPIIRH
jgi:hypothetical protein